MRAEDRLEIVRRLRASRWDILTRLRADLASGAPVEDYIAELAAAGVPHERIVELFATTFDDGLAELEQGDPTPSVFH